MARRTGFPKVARIPDDDRIVVGHVGRLRPRTATLGMGLMTICVPATIVDVFERGPEECPRAIRVRDEIDGALRFLVFTQRMIQSPRGPVRRWTGKAKKKYEDVGVDFENNAPLEAYVFDWWWDSLPATIHGDDYKTIERGLAHE